MARAFGLTPQEVRNLEIGDLEEWARQLDEKALAERMERSAARYG